MKSTIKILLMVVLTVFLILETAEIGQSIIGYVRIGFGKSINL